MSDEIKPEGSAAPAAAQPNLAPPVNKRSLRVPKPLIGIRHPATTQKVVDPSIQDGVTKFDVGLRITTPFGEVFYHTSTRLTSGLIGEDKHQLLHDDCREMLADFAKAASTALWAQITKAPPVVTRKVTELAPSGLLAATVAAMSQPAVIEETRVRRGEILQPKV